MCQNNQQPTTIVLAYDLDTSRDANINTEIKTFLHNIGWEDTYLPETTLMKANSTIYDAKLEFYGALADYDKRHTEREGREIMAHYTRAIIFAVDNYEELHRR